MRIIFFGADRWFSGSVLAALLSAGFEVPIVVTKDEEGNKFISSLVQKFGKEGKTRVIEGKTEEDISIKKMVTMVEMAKMAKNGYSDYNFPNHSNHYSHSSHSFIPDAIVLASFGPPFLPNELLSWPKYGCLNVHASLLPRWRGASPVFAALSAGDKETGVSIMRMTEEIDRGPVLGQKRIKIRTSKFQKGRSLKDTPLRIIPGAVDADTRETLTKRLGKLGGELIVETLKKLEKGQITEMPQPKKSPTPYTRRLTKESGRINWSKSPIETCPERSRRIERFIRAVTPWPGAYTNGRWTMDDGRWQEIKNIKILKAHLEGVRDFREFSRFSRESNKVENNLMLVIDLIQLAGKNPVTWKQFLAGHPEAELG